MLHRLLPGLMSSDQCREPLRKVTVIVLDVGGQLMTVSST